MNCPHPELHTQSPSGYLAWRDWADQMAKTHRQVKCPYCKMYKIWIKRMPKRQRSRESIAWSCIILLYLASLHVPLSYADQSHKYRRADWPHWVDDDRTGCNTRDDVLRAESLIEPDLADDGCTVISGRWFCLYTGKIITDPKELDVDHLVALGEAHKLGGWKWPTWRKMAYANFRDDPHHLVAVEAAANRAKGAKGADAWMPPLAQGNPRDACSYIERRRAVRERWNLNKVSRAEHEAEEDVLKTCPQKR